MISEDIFQNLESVLDELIQNASFLNQIHCEEKEEIRNLQRKQNNLLDTLISINNNINDDLKYDTFKKDKPLYFSLNQKMQNLSSLNRALLRASVNRWVKPARVHRNKRTATS